MLESELVGLYSNLSVHANPIDYIDSIRENEKEENIDTKALELIAKLRSHALPEIYIKVLTLKFVYDYNYASIATELNLPYWQTAKDIYYSAIELLRERKYK